MSREKELERLRRRHKQRERERTEAERFLRQAKNEFLGPFVLEYLRVRESALRQHKSLLGIFECSDDVFYDLDTDAKLVLFGLANFRVVMLNAVGSIDFDIDPSTRDGTVNENQPRPTGTSITGNTSVVSDGDSRRTVVFMREGTGGSDNPETTAGVKLTALFHELGHVTDIEEGINYRGDDLDLVEAESFAHHHACKELIRGRYRLSLSYYLEGLDAMVKSESEYVRLAAKAVLDSPEYSKYKAEVSPFYKSSEES